MGRVSTEWTTTLDGGATVIRLAKGDTTRHKDFPATLMTKAFVSADPKSVIGFKCKLC